MAELIDKIMAEIESDPLINAKEITLDIQSKGFLKRTKILNVNGLAESIAERDAVMKLVQHHAGDNYEVVNKMVVM
jgi:hypothetical protein